MSEILALKYRPKNFDALIGQDTITQILSLALNNKRLSHAYLFSGLRGSGKTSTARIFSKALVCDQGPTSKPCETCENCKMANENSHIDIIEMDAASSRKIDDIRDVIEQTKYKPSIARYKIFIIDEVHMLTREAFNALLKTLEEPPEYVKFILATTDPLKLPATILSRTQHFRFKKISHENITQHLSHILNEEKITFELDGLKMISRAAHGSLRDSLTLLDQAIVYSKSNITSQSVADMLGFLDTKKLENIFEAIFKEDKEAILGFVKEFESYECEVIIDEMISFLKTKFYEQDVQFSMLICERFFRILSEAKQLLFINANGGFVLGLVLFKMLEAMNIKRIDNLISSLEKNSWQIKKNIENQTAKTILPTTNSQKPETDKYQNLVDQLGNRNFELGKCFNECVSFVSFEDNLLTFKSTAKDKQRQILRQGFPIIKQFAREIFGSSINISVKQVEQEIEEETKSLTQKINDEIKNIPTQKETLSEEQMAQKAILENPIYKQAEKLFEPTSVNIVLKN